MKVTDFTRGALAIRREDRDMPKLGFEKVGEGGGKIWELIRGYRWQYKITEVQIAKCGKALWIKTAKA